MEEWLCTQKAMPIPGRPLRRWAKTVVPLAWLCLLLTLQASPCGAETAIIPVQFRNASDLLPLVKEMLSREGRIAVDVQSNSLVIVESEETIRNIQRFLSGLDKPGRQARITLRFTETGLTERSSVSADGKVSGKNWEVTTGRQDRDGVSVRLQDTVADRRGVSEHFIHVTSGRWAYITVGKEIPYTEKWIDLCRRYARAVETVGVRRIETGMDVKSVIMGDLVDIEIVPRISHLGQDGNMRVVQFAAASTRLTVPLGRWATIGGTSQESNDVMRAILEAGSGTQRASLSMSFMVEVN